MTSPAGSTGPAVADLAAHFRMRWQEVTGEQLAAPGRSSAALGLTRPDRKDDPRADLRRRPRGEFGILESYLAALRSAERLVYLENQFLWSPEIASVLCDKLRDPPSDAFRVVLVLPAHPNTGGEDTRGTLAELVEADGGARAGRRLHALCAARRRRRPDLRPREGRDRRRPLADARLGEPQRPLALQRHRGERRHARSRAGPRHARFGSGPSTSSARSTRPRATRPRSIDERWKPISAEQLERRSRGLPLTHRLVRLPHITRRTARMLGPLQGPHSSTAEPPTR